MKKAVRAISNELRRSLLSMRFLITLAICLGVLYQPVFYLREVGQGFRGMDMLNAIMSTLGIGYYVSAASLLCALACSDSYAWERMSGLYPYYLSRTGRKLYIAAKVISVSVTGGLTVSGGFAVFCVVQALLLAPGASGADMMVRLRGGRVCFSHMALHGRWRGWAYRRLSQSDSRGRHAVLYNAGAVVAVRDIQCADVEP